MMKNVHVPSSCVSVLWGQVIHKTLMVDHVLMFSSFTDKMADFFHRIF